jgi:hypothetical protein
MMEFWRHAAFTPYEETSHWHHIQTGKRENEHELFRQEKGRMSMNMEDDEILRGHTEIGTRAHANRNVDGCRKWIASAAQVIELIRVQ